jgi:hypothetical protein
MVGWVCGESLATLQYGLLLLQAPLDIDNDQMDEFYRAYRVFSDIANDPQLLLSVGIQPVWCNIP